MTTSDLIQSVKDIINNPEGDSTLSDKYILGHASRALKMHVIPAVMRLNAEFFVKHADTTLPSGDWTETNVPLPLDTFGGRLREVAYLQDKSYQSIPRLTVGQLSKGLDFAPYSFRLEGETLILRGEELRGKTLRLWYFRRPDALVTDLETASVVTKPDSLTIQLNQVPSGWVAGTQLHDDKDQFFTISSVDSDALTISVIEDTSSLEAGSMLNRVGESSHIEINADLIEPLNYITAANILAAQGDYDGSKMFKRDGMEALKAVLDQMISRVDGEAPKVIAFNELPTRIRV